MKLLKAKTPPDPTLSREAAALERRDLQRAELQRLETEATTETVYEEVGKLIDAARADPDLTIDEEDPSVRRLAEKTGRSGDKMAAVVPPKTG